MPSNRRARLRSRALRTVTGVAWALAWHASTANGQSAPTEQAPPPENAPPSAPAPPPPPEAAPVPSGPAPIEPTPTTVPPANPNPPAPLDVKPEEKEFSHGLEFVYFNVEGGYQSVGLRTLHTSNLLPETASTSGGGPFFGLGGGLRLIFLTVGPRFRIGKIDGWNTWTLDAEAGIHLPLGRVEPYFTFAAGYAKFTANDPDPAFPSLADVTIKGFNARVGAAFDVYVTKNFTIGGGATLEILAMSRSGELPTSPQAQVANCNSVMDPMQKQQCASAAVYGADGSSLGMATTLGGVLGLHF